jgi:hypothetical protein
MCKWRELRVEKLRNEDVRTKYRKLINESLHMKWFEWKQSLIDGINVQSAYELQKKVCVQSATEVCGIVRVGYKGGTERWNEEVNVAVEEKKEAYLK